MLLKRIKTKPKVGLLKIWFSITRGHTERTRMVPLLWPPLKASITTPSMSCRLDSISQWLLEEKFNFWIERNSYREGMDVILQTTIFSLTKIYLHGLVLIVKKIIWYGFKRREYDWFCLLIFQ